MMIILPSIMRDICALPSLLYRLNSNVSCSVRYFIGRMRNMKDLSRTIIMENNEKEFLSKGEGDNLV
jgi:hypothetical protein